MLGLLQTERPAHNKDVCVRERVRVYVCVCVCVCVCICGRGEGTQHFCFLFCAIVS
jgi:hypothetical protein